MELGSISSVLKTLSDKGVIEIESRRRMRPLRGGLRSGRLARLSFVASAKPELTSGQAEAQGYRGRPEAGWGSRARRWRYRFGQDRGVFAGDRDALARGEGAIVLVLEISLTPQTVARFAGVSAIRSQSYIRA